MKKFRYNETFYYLCNVTRMNYVRNKTQSDVAWRGKRIHTLTAEKPRKKILYNIQRVTKGEINEIIFEKLNNNIWEFRTIYNNVKYRLLPFWDPEKKALIVATHGFTKTTQKTPLKEIAKAEAIRKEYLTNKEL